MHRNVLMLILLAVATLLPGCQSLQNWAPTFVRPYRPDIQQGNIVTKEMVDQLRPGMTAHRC
jgi:outer membrane protein assembly factor BamE